VPKIATSERLAGVLNGLGVPSSAVTVVSQGLNLAVFRPPHPALPRGHRVSVLVGPDAGAATALEALERTRALLPTMEVTAFGAGRRPERLPSWIRYLRSLPTHELVRQVYQRDAVHLGNATSAAQAMACGSAVVGVRGSALADFVEHDRDGLLVEPGDVNAMAESLVRLMLDRELRTRLVAGGVRTAGSMDSADSAVALEKALRGWTEAVAPQV
jgi:glycosyltransferase involved in cell wall biosynthesis